MSVSPEAFDTFAELMARHAGLKLTREKAYLLPARLGALMRSENCETLEILAARCRAGSPRLQAEVAEAMLNNETFFFRDRVLFDRFADTILPQLMAKRTSEKRLRIWSAACSTGQEPYSLSILMEEAGAKLNGWTIELLASDLSGRALGRAKDGIYSQFEVQRGLDTPRLLSWFRKDGDKWQIDERIRSRVRFSRHNLLHPAGHMGKFDIIFARNVLMYFETPTKTKVLKELHAHLAPHGLLVLGAAETVFGNQDLFAVQEGCHGFYTRRAPLEPARDPTRGSSLPDNRQSSGRPLSASR